MRLPRPLLTTPLFSLDAPLTSQHLLSIRKTLASQFEIAEENVPGESHAAVLIPLCNINSKPGILYEVRGKLRHHAGEVSFPGGKVDPTDSSYLDAALRETHEEIGIPPGQVEVLGRIGPSTISLSGLRVHSFVGFLHASSMDSPTADPSNEAPLASPDLKTLVLSPNEVVHVFHEPFTSLVDAARLRTHKFRDGVPYFVTDVSEHVQDLGIELPIRTPEDEIGGSGSKSSLLEIWGLTGWYTNVFMKAMQLYQ